MSASSEKVKRWRKKTKARMITAMGGKCQSCEYDRCDEALEFHHLDPNEKDFGFGATRASPKNWDTIVTELRKCVLLCSNCHREVHTGIREVPDNAASFNEKYADYKTLERDEKKHPCLMCDTPTPPHKKYCSRSCATKASRSVDWDTINIPSLLNEYGTITAVAETLGVSDGAVHKRMRKLGLK